MVKQTSDKKCIEHLSKSSLIESDFRFPYHNNLLIGNTYFSNLNNQYTYKNSFVTVSELQVISN